MPYNPYCRDQIELPLFFFWKKIKGWLLQSYVLKYWVQNSTQDDTFFCDRAIFTLCNDVVADFNQKLLDKLPRELYIYDSIDAVEDNAEEQQHLPQEFLRSLIPSGLPPSTHCLKVGALIVLLRNLYPASGECNGTRLIITQLGRRCIEGWMPRGEFNSQLCLIPRIYIDNNRKWSFLCSYLTTIFNSPLFCNDC